MDDNVTNVVLDAKISMDLNSIIYKLEDDIKSRVYEVLFENSIIFRYISKEQVYVRTIEMDLDYDTVKVSLYVFDDNGVKILDVNLTLNI